MAEQTRTVLKSYFETGDKPTQAQFGELIDSVPNKQDDGYFTPTTISDSATPTANCLSYIQKLFEHTTTQTAETITFTNITNVKIIDISIFKTNAANVIITLSGSGWVFDIWDSANKCYTRGTNVTLSGAAGKSFELSLLVTDTLYSGSKRVQVTGTISSFA